jgi:hypothetical protein
MGNYTGSLPGTPADRNSLLHVMTQSGTFIADITEEKFRTSKLFRPSTCDVLSIREDCKHPSVSMVWPVVLGHPVLYYAIAALICLQTSHP